MKNLIKSLMESTNNNRLTGEETGYYLRHTITIEIDDHAGSLLGLFIWTKEDDPGCIGRENIEKEAEESIIKALKKGYSRLGKFEELEKGAQEEAKPEKKPVKSLYDQWVEYFEPLIKCDNCIHAGTCDRKKIERKLNKELLHETALAGHAVFDYDISPAEGIACYSFKHRGSFILFCSRDDKFDAMKAVKLIVIPGSAFNDPNIIWKYFDVKAKADPNFKPGEWKIEQAKESDSSYSEKPEKEGQAGLDD